MIIMLFSFLSSLVCVSIWIWCHVQCSADPNNEIILFILDNNTSAHHYMPNFGRLIMMIAIWFNGVPLNTLKKHWNEIPFFGYYCYCLYLRCFAYSISLRCWVSHLAWSVFLQLIWIIISIHLFLGSNHFNQFQLSIGNRKSFLSSGPLTCLYVSVRFSFVILTSCQERRK